MSSLLVRTGVASGENVSVIRLADRRDGTIEKDWVFQREVEAALYGHGFAQQNGAVYQLLRRSGVSSQSLPLKKASTANAQRASSRRTSLVDCTNISGTSAP